MVKNYSKLEVHPCLKVGPQLHNSGLGLDLSFVILAKCNIYAKNLRITKITTHTVILNKNSVHA